MLVDNGHCYFSSQFICLLQSSEANVSASTIHCIARYRCFLKKQWQKMFQILHYPFSVEGVYLSETLTFSSKPKSWYVVIFILSYFISTASIKGLQGICTSDSCRSYWRNNEPYFFYLQDAEKAMREMKGN